MQTATGRDSERLPGKQSHTGCRAKGSARGRSTLRAEQKPGEQAEERSGGSRGARDSPGTVSPDPSGRARLPSASWPRCRGISLGGTQGPRPAPASPPQTERIGLLGPLGSPRPSRQAKIFSLTTQGWTGLLGK